MKATVSVAGVAAAVAAISATSAKTTLSETSVIHNKSVAIASAAALVASHCIEIAEEMGADQDQILTVVDSAINARTSGDIMTLTAGVATGIPLKIILIDLYYTNKKGHHKVLFHVPN